MLYSGKQVAILGYGVEGESAYRYFKSQGAQVTICDRDADLDLPPAAGSQLGGNYLKDLDQFDLVVRSPGVLPASLATKAPITSVTNEFLARSKAKVIGVTGSKGKGTVATLIYELLQAAGKRVWLGGNIGKPPLDFVDALKADDLVVLEMSNLQLWDIKRSPHVAVILEIFPEHLDWHHGNMAEYVATKANIVRYQGPNDVVIYNSKNQYATDIGESSAAKHIPYLNESGANINNGAFYVRNEEIANTADVRLLGDHNLQNACAAIAAAWLFTADKQAIQKALRNFKGLKHRLELVAEKHQVKYFDDSIGTTPESTIAAINSFDQPKILILGGSDKGANFDNLAKVIIQSEVNFTILIGDTAVELKRALLKAGYNKAQIIEGLITMEQVVKTAATKANSGDVVLLSPACASFGMFRNYQDRGNQFRASVNKL